MVFDADVALFLCADEDSGDPAGYESLLTDVNATLARLGLPPHREPRTPGDVVPPLPPGTDVCGLGTRLGFYGDPKYERLSGFARHLAVHGAVPPPGGGPYDPDIERAYRELPDRRRCFDHVIATATYIGTVVLPRPLARVVSVDDRPVAHGDLVSAHRLRVESVALGYALRYAGDSPVADWTTGRPLDDLSFAGLEARLPGRDDAVRAWTAEADLCNRLVNVAADVLRTGALGLTG